MSTDQYSAELGSTSTSLLNLIRIDDPDGWRQVSELYGPLIYGWCRKCRLSPEDSADILQDVFRSLIVHVATYEPRGQEGSFRSWLWVITRNKVRDHIRTQSDKTQALGGSDANNRLLQCAEELPEIEESIDLAGDGSVLRVLRLIKKEVKESTWNAFWRTTIDGVHPSAVADELQISIHSVWQARSRILRRARQLLES